MSDIQSTVAIALESKTMKKPSPFASWSRTKATTSKPLGKGNKREGDPIEREPETSKRSRSGQYTAS